MVHIFKNQKLIETIEWCWGANVNLWPFQEKTSFSKNLKFSLQTKQEQALTHGIYP